MIELPVKSPRAWKSDVYCKNVFVGFSEKKNQLFVIDRGIGMNRLDLRRFLFKVSGSGYKNTDMRTFAFPGIANFGIGFVSCLINASHIEIYTKRNDDEGCKVVLEEGLNLAFLQKFDSENFNGTVIKLDLKQRFSYKSISDYMKETFVHPSVGITYVDLDEMENVAQLLGLKTKYEKVVNDTYNYIELLDEINRVKGPRMKEFMEKLDLLGNMDTGIDELVDWIHTNLEVNEKVSDSVKFREFKAQVVCLENVGKLLNSIVGENFPLNRNNISEKELFTGADEYEDKVKKYQKRIWSVRKEQEELKNRIQINNVTIEANALAANILPWKYLVAYVDDNLQICDVVLENQKVNLAGKKGIIFIHQLVHDYEKGIEFEVVNGFIFSDGRLCNNIARFREIIQESAYDIKKRYVLIGGMDEYDDMEYALEEEYQRRLEDYGEGDYYGYNRGGEYTLGIQYEDVYDVLYLYENKIKQEMGLEFSKYAEVRERNLRHDLYDEMGYVDVLQYMFAERAQDDKFSIAFQNFETLLYHNTSSYYQDGIKVNCSIGDIFPIGYFTIQCNCTADARMALNVTRHKPSELIRDVEKWTKEVGCEIQKAILKGVMEALDELELEVEFTELMLNDIQDNVFSHECKAQFKQMLYKMHGRI